MHANRINWAEFDKAMVTKSRPAAADQPAATSAEAKYPLVAQAVETAVKAWQADGRTIGALIAKAKPLTRQALADIRNGERPHTADSVKAICGALGIDQEAVGIGKVVPVATADTDPAGDRQKALAMLQDILDTDDAEKFMAILGAYHGSLFSRLSRD